MRPSLRACTLAGCAVGSGVLYAACFAPTPATAGALLAWIALVPLFWALRGRGVAAAAGLAALFGCTATALSVRWIVPTLGSHFDWSLAPSLLFLTLLSASTAAPFLAGAFALVHAGGRPLHGVRGCALLAAAFVASELLRTHLGLRSPWATLGVTQAEATHIRQLADIGGVYAVSALVAFVNAAIADTLAQRGARDLRPACAAAIAVLCALLYGEMRVSQLEADSAGPTLDVLLVQGDIAPELRWKRTQASRVLRRYGGLTRDELLGDEARPDLVIWPENALQTSVDDPTYGPPLLSLARSVPLLIGAPRHAQDESGRREYNTAHLIDRHGAAAHYDKRRLLPFSETSPLGDLASFGSRGDLDSGNWSAGNAPGVFTVDGHVMGVLICMEALYPALAREAIAEGAQVLVNLSNDGWFMGPGALEQHFAHVVLRAVETRRPLLRVTPTGITAIVSPAGEVVARLEPGERGVLRAAVPSPDTPASIHARLGDVFAIACLLVCALPATLRACLERAAHLTVGRAPIAPSRPIA